MPDAGLYPASPSARDRFVLERRGHRPQHDPWRFQGLIVEDELGTDGTIERIATAFLTGRECPWRCAMCDLWMYTTAGDTPPGAIPGQITAARAVSSDQAIAGMKLYNAGSFFDPRAVPETDYDAIAASLGGLSRVIVESHPALVGVRVDRLRAALDRHSAGSEGPAALEVAMGLETAHPQALDALNKRFTLGDFAAAAKALRQRDVALRVFLLISPPFIPPADQDEWLRRSLDAAFACDASVVSLVPTRTGNGAMEALAAAGSFRSPSLDDIERSFALALTHAAGRGRVFVDVWDLDRFAPCGCCFAARRARLETMNRQQCVLPPCPCPSGHHAVFS